MSDTMVCPWNSLGKNSLGEGVATPFPGDLPNPGSQMRSPASQADSSPSERPFASNLQNLWLTLHGKRVFTGKIKVLGRISVQLSCSVMSDSLWPHGLQHARLPRPSPTPGACSSSCPFSRWCHPTNSSSVTPFSSSLQSFPVSGYFQMSQFLASGDQTIGASASTSILPMNIQDWFPLGLTGWISLQSKGLSRVFSNTTVQMHQFFSTQLSL